MLTQSSNALTVAQNSIATSLGIAAPVDTSYGAADLGVTVTSLPSNGTILLADGLTPVVAGQNLTVVQLVGLKFRPLLNGYSSTSNFGFRVADPLGTTADATSSVTIGPALTPVRAPWQSLEVPPNSRATPIGIVSPSDANYASSALTVTIAALPTNGNVYLANGTTAITAGQTLTAAQLSGLMFKSASTGAGKESNLLYSVRDPAGNTTTGRALLVVGPSTPPVVAPSTLVVAANAGATPIGISAPKDQNYASSNLVVTVNALPTDGRVVLGDGVTDVANGQSLTVSQLTRLAFIPNSGASSQSSSFQYGVRDPSGASTTGSATLSIGASATPLVTTPTSLTVIENSAAQAMGIKAPSDSAYASSALSIQLTALPTNGAVYLEGAATPLSVGATLTANQLAGLVFEPTRGNTGQSSNLTYTVSDPGGNTASGVASLTTGPNAIVIENQKQGTPQSVWSINPGQDSSILQGFTTAISTNLGDTVDFKVNNRTSNPNYTINIYRLGYYGGDGATLVTTLQHQAGSSVVQPAPLTDPATGLVDAGNWQVTDSWAVPTDATSGVYIANITEGGEIFQIPFIVRDDNSQSDIVFQTADQTWQAYNGWGGTNVYGGGGPGYGGAAYAVSYNRPITTRDESAGPTGGGPLGNSNDMVFGAEYPAILWLEQNGYDVSYVSGIDISNNGSLLLNHKVYMEAGHDEYWTNAQYNNVKAAADAGVNLVFLSGNEIYWQTRTEPSIAGNGGGDRTLVTYKDTHANALIDPSGTSTSSYLDPRFESSGGLSGVPSNALTGTVFSVDGNRADSIEIPYEMTQLRFWRNSPVAATAPGGTATLPKNILGYEWDSAPDDAFRPAGLVALSSTTLEVQTKLLDYGNTVGAGTATHNLVAYRNPVSGALVFSAGTVFWTWGLSDNHDQFGGSNPGPQMPTDPSVQQSMVNLFADMGVQPETLQASLVIANASTDATAPTSTITNISATTIPEAQTVTVTGTANDIGGLIGGVEVSTDGGTTWRMATSPVGVASVNWTYSFESGAAGTWSVQSRAVDDSLNLQVPGPGVAYTVTPAANLTIFDSTDVPSVLDDVDSSAIEVGMKFTSASAGEITGIRFYKGPSNIGTHVADLWTSTGTLLASATFTNETVSGWQQVDFAAPIHIQANTDYVASYHTNVGGYSSTPFYFHSPGVSSGPLSAIGKGQNGLFAYSADPAFPSNVSFATGTNYWVDVVFTDTSQQPQALDDGNFSVAANTTLTIAAAELLANDSDPAGLSFSISGVSNPSHGQVSYDTASQTVSFVPDADYFGAANFTYTITDTSGASGAGRVSLNVENPISTQTLFGSAETPGVISANDSSAVELGVKFVAASSGRVTGIRFYKGQDNVGPHIADLWTASGDRLATAVFTNETASGWQQVNFTTPVSITAGTTYVASYHTASGEYSADANYFATAQTNGALTAPSSGSSGGNGVYTYGSSSAFPTSTFQATNYWVDVVFDSSVMQNPVAQDDSGFSVNQGDTLIIAASSLLANDSDPSGLALSVTGVSGAINGSASYDATAQQITFTPTAGYAGPASFVYAISDTSGATASGTVGLSVVNPASQSLFASNATPTQIAVNDPSAVELGVKFSASQSGEVTGIRFYKSTQNTGVHSADLWSATGVLLASATFANETASGWQQVNFAAPVSITAGTTYVAAYHTNTGYYAANSNYFTSSVVNGALTAPSSATSGGNGVYAYGSDNIFPTSTYQASNYWVDVVFSGSTLSAPVANNDSGFFVNQNGSLTIAASVLLANDTDANGLPLSITNVSGATNGTVSYNASTQNITFTPTVGYSGNASFSYTISDGAVVSTPAQVTVSVGSAPPIARNDAGFVAQQNNSVAIPVAALLANDSDPGGLSLSITGVSAPTHGTVSYDQTAQTIIYVPTANYAGAASFSYAVSNGSATASASASLIVNDPSTVTVFNPATAPTGPAVNENYPVELGFKFQVSSAGQVTGLRFYKDDQNTGTHTADLWSASGSLLATATFTAETASGWQQVNFSSPVTLTPGQTYIAAYHTNGAYSLDAGLFANEQTNGPLTALSSAASGGNGVYAYGTSDLFPSSSFNSNSYGVDVVFKPQLAS